MRYLYSIILYLLTPVVLLKLIWAGFSNQDYWHRWLERFGIAELPDSTRPVIWLHAVSVGEVQASLPIVQRLLIDNPQYQLLVTTVTPTGSAMVRQKFGVAVLHCYLPYDLPHVVSRFLDRVRPVALIILETEIWPNLYHHCHKRGIKLLLVNARLSEKSLNGYRKIAGFTRQVLANLDLIAAQTEADAQRLVALGADRSRLTVTGNLKFDVGMPVSTVERGRSIRRFLGRDRPVWIAASTHVGEESIILAAHRKIIDKYPDCLLVLVPRHPERSPGILELSTGCGLTALCKSKAYDNNRNDNIGDLQVFILDSIGELPDYYAAADVAFVGGSLLPPYGGHNVLEPAALGVPVLTGLYTSNFKEITGQLIDNHAGFQVIDSEQLAVRVVQLIADAGLRQRMGEAAGDLVLQNQGSAGRIMEMVSNIVIGDNNRVDERN